MRGSGARSSGCSGAAPAHWHCVDLAALDNGAGAAGCEFGQLRPKNRVSAVPQPLRHRARTLARAVSAALPTGSARSRNKLILLKHTVLEMMGFKKTPTLHVNDTITATP